MIVHRQDFLGLADSMQPLGFIDNQINNAAGGFMG